MKDLSQLIQFLRMLSENWQAIKAQGGTLDVDALMEEIQSLMGGKSGANGQTNSAMQRRPA